MQEALFCQALGLAAPWAVERVALDVERSRFTLMFEALALTLAREMPVAACARILRCADNALWRQIDAHVSLARAKESCAGVAVIGIDETSCAKGHSYITLVHDLERARLIYATPGKDASTVQRFTEDFKSHQGRPEAIQVVCMDMSKAFIAGTGQHLPQAAIAFDGFHVVQMANRAVDAVRREEAGGERWLKKTRWCWLKDKAKWTDKEQAKMDWLPRTRLKTARAWRMKEALRDVYRNSDADAASSAQALKKWLHWAQRSRLQPFKDLAKTIKQHWAGILKAFDASHLHTGYVEAVNSLLQAAKAKARGYGTTDHFIAMAFLIAGKLTHLPGSPLQKARA